MASVILFVASFFLPTFVQFWLQFRQKFEIFEAREVRLKSGAAAPGCERETIAVSHRNSSLRRINPLIWFSKLHLGDEIYPISYWMTYAYHPNLGTRDGIFGVATLPSRPKCKLTVEWLFFFWELPSAPASWFEANIYLFVSKSVKRNCLTLNLERCPSFNGSKLVAEVETWPPTNKEPRRGWRIFETATHSIQKFYTRIWQLF